MSNFTPTGNPVAQTRGTSSQIRSEFSLIQTAINSKGDLAGQAWTGAHIFTASTLTAATQTQGDNSTKVATTAYADTIKTYGTATYAPIASPTFTGTVTIPSGASIGGYALLASPALTGVPTAPTAAGGTATNQIATTSFVTSTAFNVNLPGQTGNNGKFVTTDGSSASWALPIADQATHSGQFLTTNGTTTSWADAKVANVVTATTATTLTTTPTLLSITPASYGVAITLPDATTCSVGGPLHKIDNKGAYPVKVLNSAGTLIGFVFAGVASDVSLVDKSTAAGVWSLTNLELVGASAQLLTTALNTIYEVLDIGSSREFILCRGTSTANVYGVIYSRATNTFGAATLIRTASIDTAGAMAVVSATDQILVCSVTTTSNAFEAVTLTISGTGITVNTAATATLSGNSVGSPFSRGSLVAVGSAFSIIYAIDTPASQIRALSISGTSVTISAAAVLPGTTANIAQLVASSTIVIAASCTATNVYTTPYTFSGSSTPSVGTGTTTGASSAPNIVNFAALGTRWFIAFTDGSGGTTPKVGVVSLSGTTTTISTAAVSGTNTSYSGSFAISSSKMLCYTSGATLNVNILTDSAGTASLGTAITVSSGSARAGVYLSGTNVVFYDNPSSAPDIHVLDCSGASPVVTASYSTLSNTTLTTGFAVPDTYLNQATSFVSGTNFAQSLGGSSNTNMLRFNGAYVLRPVNAWERTYARGRNNAERWALNANKVLTKLECTP